MLDHFGEIVVAQQVEREYTSGEERGSESSIGVKVSLLVRLRLSLSDKSTGKTTAQSRSKTSGRVRHRVQFGATSRLFQKVMDDHEAARCWLLFDEWSGIQLDLQPYLGEMLRRIFFASSKVSVRIAAIPHRTEWRISHAPGQYVGLEIGAEVFPLLDLDLDLDEFVVFPARNRELQIVRAVGFFKNLLFFPALSTCSPMSTSPGRQSRRPVPPSCSRRARPLEELIRAAEGVPRDALSLSGQRRDHGL